MATKIGLTLMPLLAAASLSITPAFASATERTIEVHHTDLDLSTEAGQAKFKQRVMRADMCFLTTLEPVTREATFSSSFTFHSTYCSTSG